MFTKEEMLCRLRDGESAVSVSAEKWRRVVEAGESGQSMVFGTYGNNCALCYVHNMDCAECDLGNLDGCLTSLSAFDRFRSALYNGTLKDALECARELLLTLCMLEDSPDGGEL